ncbi:MAG: Bax inhibitor-1/YccA family protein [Marinobacterium sp.]|nr:Bax inhibitor-1/YccA family protein [Marinobacterium sp.]
MRKVSTYEATQQESLLSTNKMIRNTYMLLAMTMAFSAVMAVVSMIVNPPPFTHLLTVIGSFVMLFILNKKQNSAAALPLVFAFTGMLGFGLGPILNQYMGLSNGGEIVGTALGMTALTFFGLSAYVLTTRKDFSFMGGFLAAGMIVVVIAMLALLVLPMFGVDTGLAPIALSAVIVLLMAGFILYDTSNIVNGHYTNYIMATVSLYLNIYNLFINLLMLTGFLSED